MTPCAVGGLIIDGHKVEVSLSSAKRGNAAALASGGKRTRDAVTAESAAAAGGATGSGGVGAAAKAGGASDGPASRDKKNTKLVVRNIAFETSRKDLRQLFSAFGELKQVRLPKKFTGGNRGFAFIEFASHREAVNAFEALASTHLYGRHMVLEWAEDDADLETLRDRAARDVRSNEQAEKDVRAKKRVRLSGEE